MADLALTLIVWQGWTRDPSPPPISQDVYMHTPRHRGEGDTNRVLHGFTLIYIILTLAKSHRRANREL